MATLRELRTRVSSIKNIQRVTNAMLAELRRKAPVEPEDEKPDLRTHDSDSEPSSAESVVSAMGSDFEHETDSSGSSSSSSSDNLSSIVLLSENVLQ